MKCDKCNVEMEDGVIIDSVWIPLNTFTSLSQKINTRIIGLFSGISLDTNRVVAAKGPKCGIIALYIPK